MSKLIVGDVETNSINGGPLAGFRNAIINGGFDHWQRGTSFTPAGGAYTADRWVVGAGAGGVATVSRSTHAVGSGFGRFYLRHNQTAGGVFPFIAHRVESVLTFAGKAVTVSFNASVPSTISVEVILRQYFGTGGSPSAIVDTSAGSVSVTTSLDRHSITATLPSISGKTLGSNNNDYAEVIFRLPDGTIFDLSLWDVQLEAGSVATPFERRPVGTELALCQRYFQVMRANLRFIAAGGGHYLTAPLIFMTQMRAAPAVSRTAGSSSNVANVELDSATASGCRFGIISASAGDCFLFTIDIIADAEI